MIQNKNIYITGFMGSGKSTIGRLLAEKLQRKYADTDEMIEQSAQKSINEIFQTEGEPHFRKLESQTLAKLDQETNLVVSLGGGAIIDPKNQKIINKGIWIYLNVPFEVIKERVMRKSHRPLAKNTNELEDLYKKRLPVYLRAQFTIDCPGEAEDTCEIILDKISDS